MEKNFYYRGTIIEFYNPDAYNPGIEKFILAESFEENYVFQIICISGYNASRIEGLIKEAEIMIKLKQSAISHKHLIKELNRNFGEIEIRSLKVFTS